MFPQDSFWKTKCPRLDKVGFLVFSEDQLRFLKCLMQPQQGKRNAFLGSHLLKFACQPGKLAQKSSLSLQIEAVKMFFVFEIDLEIDLKQGSHAVSTTAGDKYISIGEPIWEAVENLEVFCQLRSGRSILASDLYPDLEDSPHPVELIPVDWKTLNLMSPGKRREFLEMHEKETLFGVGKSPTQILGIDAEQYDLLKYGETGLTLQVKLAAERGDEKAKVMWEALQSARP